MKPFLERKGVTAAMLYGLHAEVVGAYDEPYVLVRRITEQTSCLQIEVVAREEWMEYRRRYEGDEIGLLPAGWDVKPCRLYRWVPDAGSGEYSRWIHHADKPGPGAFWAVEVHPARVPVERAS